MVALLFEPFERQRSFYYLIIEAYPMILVGNGKGNENIKSCYPHCSLLFPHSLHPCIKNMQNLFKSANKTRDSLRGSCVALFQCSLAIYKNIRFILWKKEHFTMAQIKILLKSSLIHSSTFELYMPFHSFHLN